MKKYKEIKNVLAQFFATLFVKDTTELSKGAFLSEAALWSASWQHTGRFSAGTATWMGGYTKRRSDLMCFNLGIFVLESIAKQLRMAGC